MKNYLLVFIAVFSLHAYAQDYTGQHSGYVHFYRPLSSNIIERVQCDSSGVSGTDSIYHYRVFYRDVAATIPAPCTLWGSPNCQYYRDLPSVMGTYTKASDRMIEFYNVNGDTIHLDMHMNIGDSSIVYEDGVQRIRIKLLAEDTLTNFGTPDSVLTFSFIHTDLADALLTSSLNGYTTVFSKLYGMMNGYAMDSFPQVLKPVELLGVRGPNVGFHGITPASAFDFQAGDEYEISTSTTSSGPPINNWHHYTILSRADYTTSVMYNVQVDHQELETSMGWPYYYVYSTETFYVYFFKTHFVDESPPGSSGGYTYSEKYYIDSVLLGCNVPSYAYEANQNGCLAVCSPGDPCLLYADCYMTSTDYVKYRNKAGKIREQSYSIPMPWNGSSATLVYTNFSGVECGYSTIGITENEALNQKIQVYPNPANDKITVDAGSAGTIIHSVSVLSVDGKKTVPAMPIKNTITTISTTSLAAGCYWLLFETAHGPVAKKLVIAR